MSFFIALLAGCTTIHVKETDVLKPDNVERVEDALPEGYQFQEHFLTRADGTVSYGISVTHPENTTSVMYFGGNMFYLQSGAPGVVRRLSKAKTNLFMFDHRGYGKSTGKPTVALLQKDALENYDFVRSQAHGKLVVYGFSLGSFEAGHVADNRTLDGLVLEGSATNVDEWSDTLVPWYAKPLVTVKIADELRAVNNLAVVSRLQSPLLLVVGKDDSQTPATLSKRLYEQAGSKHKTLFIAEGKTHSNATSHPDFIEVYKKFLQQIN